MNVWKKEKKGKYYIFFSCFLQFAGKKFFYNLFKSRGLEGIKEQFSKWFSLSLPILLAFSQ